MTQQTKDKHPGALLFINGRLVDGAHDRAVDGISILIADGRVQEISDKAITSSTATVVDLKGRTVMPGLIDAHVHVVAGEVNLGANALLPDSLVAARAAHIMKGMLHRGFTTVRDVGGADHGLVVAVEEGAITGPRLVISGKALSQTGGHCDFRGRYDSRDPSYFDRRLGSLGRMCDGVDAVRKAAREEIKQGATFIKVMANGGVASPTDPIGFMGFSRDELLAVAEEARNAQTYVSAHLYTDEAIRRGVECGILSVEHANLIQPETARLMASLGAMACPTLVTYEALKDEGASLGLPQTSVDKIDDVRLAGLRSLEIMRDAGVTMAYGSDLLGEMHRHQSEEFVIRARVLPTHEVIRSATHDAAKLMRMEGQIGSLVPGAHGDLIVLEGDPLKDISLLTRQGQHMSAIVKDGRFIKNTLA